MNGTHKAVEVSAPGVLRVVERPLAEPGPGQVRIPGCTTRDRFSDGRAAMNSSGGSK